MAAMLYIVCVLQFSTISKVAFYSPSVVVTLIRMEIIKIHRESPGQMRFNINQRRASQTGTGTYHDG